MTLEKALVVFSGGQDSTTCLYWAKQRFSEVSAVTFSYAQRHALEIESARKIAELAGIKHELINLGPLFAGDSPLTSKQFAVPQYADASVLPHGLETTFVPGRNILFLTLAANRAYVAGYKHLVIGVTQEDFGGYPDCRQEFIDAMQRALSLGLDCDITIHAPLQHLNKKEIVELAGTLDGCMEGLKYSTTCYNGVFPPCGSCHSCLLRERGFREAGIPDPLMRAPV
jgi:7-cyano-7-deazaguanine synthase